MSGPFGDDWEAAAIPLRFNFGRDVIDRQAREDDRDALITVDAAGSLRRLRYSDISEASDRFGSLLRAQNVAKGDRVLIMLPRIAEWVIAMVGALKIGAVPVPCIEMLTARDIRYRLEDSGARAVVCRSDQVEKFNLRAMDGILRIALGGAEGWLDLARALEAADRRLTPAMMLADDPAIIYYTSGSSGSPKGVLHASRALYAWRNSARDWLDLTPDDRIWCTADTGWSKAGTSILFGPLSCGACSFLYDGPFDAGERLRLLAEHHITVYCAPGTELYRVAGARGAEHDLSFLRRTVSAGEAVSPAIAERWEAATGVRIDEAYGQTETLMIVHNRSDRAVRYGSMGLPAAGCEIAVIDADGAPVAAGEEGDLALGAPCPQLMIGYWRDEARSRACYRQGADALWYVTGDRARQDSDGYIWYCGRRDDLINSAGYRIGPLEIENVLMEHPAVAACAVVGSPDAERGEIVKAFIVAAPGAEPGDPLAALLQAHVKAATAPYKYPRTISFVADLPTTPTGKISRRALRDQEYARP